MIGVEAHQFVYGLTTIAFEYLKTISFYKIVVVQVGQHAFSLYINYM